MAGFFIATEIGALATGIAEQDDQGEIKFLGTKVTYCLISAI
jgi:hypothetical protein